MMRRLASTVGLLWASVLLALTWTELVAADSMVLGDHEPDDDTESDSAPFMIVVEHGGGNRRCGGSLVSLRTALTSAWCVRGPHGASPRELWALSPGAYAMPTSTRRIARVALVAGAEADAQLTEKSPAWLGAAQDIAVLELEAPFGGGAHSRPILMATRLEDCAVGAVCHIVRVRGRAPRLRIVDATLVPGQICNNVAPGWPGLRESALCLKGPTLCSSDRGAGVVCDGKLCGVLSRSAQAPNATAAQNMSMEATIAPKGDATCGDTHVALSVARMRRFLHCAHTLRACGRGGECSQHCSERQLMVLEANDDQLIASSSEDTVGKYATVYTEAVRTEDTETKLTSELPEVSPSAVVTTPARTSIKTLSTTVAVFDPVQRTPSQTTPSRSIPPSTLTTTMTVPMSTLRPSFEFEPNRADFKGAPVRTSRVYLKAGEYGDNALEYNAAEEGPSGGGTVTATSETPGNSTKPVESDNKTKLITRGRSELIEDANDVNGSLETVGPDPVFGRYPNVRMSQVDAQHVKEAVRNVAISITTHCIHVYFVFVIIIFGFVN